LFFVLPFHNNQQERFEMKVPMNKQVSFISFFVFLGAILFYSIWKNDSVFFGFSLLFMILGIAFNNLIFIPYNFLVESRKSIIKENIVKGKI
jgi:hypothetical protein